ncbi:hypothetical protein ASPCADRAFT_179148 [Aspergillus carbonarius ITEM 5010]|uniref:Uncharacterized protein n=1 Tax=Aspergillus carbonarius (strain ITEM 5010) TaxID=602072 RepID=A0A1R3R7B4_ASPC5|nr:hypothetical protein ASPCADRAFT_179148 [Aspergillus carbonarius ITEM 5010]
MPLPLFYHSADAEYSYDRTRLHGPHSRTAHHPPTVPSSYKNTERPHSLPLSMAQNRSIHTFTPDQSSISGTSQPRLIHQLRQPILEHLLQSQSTCMSGEILRRE